MTRRTPIATSGRAGSIGTARTQERVLRIVFQPYVDGRGRLHEASAVHAVVRRGEWQSEAVAYATPLSDVPAGAPSVREMSLAEVVDRADQSVSLVTIDPDLPDPDIVAAARARKADPIGALKADVAARLAAKPARGAGIDTPKTTEGRAGSRTVAAPVAAARGVSASGLSEVTPSPQPPAPRAQRATAGLENAPDKADATDRIKTDPRLQSAGQEIERTAREAVGSVPDLKPKIGATVHSARFPATVMEDN